MEHEDGKTDETDDAVNGSFALDTASLEDIRDVPANMDAFLAGIERRAWRMAEIHLGNRDDALDAVQDAMLRLVRHYGDKPAGEWTPLFWGILRRRIVDLQRRRKVRSIVVGWIGGGRDDEGDELPSWDPADDAPDPSARLQDSQAYTDIVEALRRLPRRQREAFTFRVMEGLDREDTPFARDAFAARPTGGMAMSQYDRNIERRARELYLRASRDVDPATAGRLRAARRTALAGPRESMARRLLIPASAFAMVALASLIVWQPGGGGNVVDSSAMSQVLDNEPPSDLPPDADSADPTLYQNLQFYSWLAYNDTPSSSSHK
ncbi:hypothetical protein KCV01_g6827, partial [Aureobasidium melanogenum]